MNKHPWMISGGTVALTLTLAMLIVVVSMLWRVPVACAEPTVTVYKDPT
jgi:hypothetical protein